MRVYVDYDFYKEQGGTMDESAFDRAALKASAYIRSITLGRSDNYVGDELKYATCEVANVFNVVFTQSEEQIGAIKSENNDGYSVTYVSEMTEGETREALFRRKAYDAARSWLLGTGLLNRKVGNCYCGGDCCDNEC